MYLKHICISLLYISLVFNVIVKSCNHTEGDCLNGVCSEGNCICNPGWIGDKCDHCGGRIRLNSTSGYIHESLDVYSTNSKCTWLLDSGKIGSTIDLKLEDFSTECSWDYLYVYDGDSVFSPQLAAFSGLIKHQDVEVEHELRATSGYAYLHFYSDAAYTLEGFNLSYSVNTCLSDCSDHGDCSADLKCNCHSGWYSDSCSLELCPLNCSSNGICNTSCECSPGYKGIDCNTELSEGMWTIKDSSLPGRSSHAVVIDNGYLWSISGFMFDNEQYTTVVQYDLDTSSESVIPIDSSTPLQRYGHSAVLYQGFIYMFGGDVNGETMNELWAFDTFNGRWEANLTTPEALAVEGHTAHVVDDKMLVFFGFNPSYGYTNIVQEYDFTNNTWSRHKTDGAFIYGSYGHSSVYDPKRRKVYLHGGYKSSTDQHISTELYSYDVDARGWMTLKESTLPRYLHSAVLIDDIMYVFGGNMHNDTRKSNGAKCYSSQFMAYDIECGVWSSIEATSVLPKDIARYGHAAVMYNGSMLVHGGFNGQMFNDILLYELGECSTLDEVECTKEKPGLKCAYDRHQQLCIPLSQATNTHGNYSLPVCNGKRDDVTCSSLKSCTECLQRFGCGWCDGKCDKNCKVNVNCSEDVPCNSYKSCSSCEDQLNRCVWSRSQCTNKKLGSITPPTQCPATCQDYQSCESCSEDEDCMWCNNQMQCVESNTYVTSFPYGLCMEWHNIKGACPPPTCSGYQSCTDCQMSPSCGWCDDGSGTGTGMCMEGGFTGPLDFSGTSMLLNTSMCTSNSWNFVGCPACQCNGHSECVNKSVCLNCTDNTTGEHCEMCTSGFFGNPENGGQCEPCVCNENAEVCDIYSGACYCTTKGIIGDMCDICDTKAKYRGDPSDGGTCYYELEMNFRYNFNLSKAEDSYYTKINMLVEPSKNNRDIDFILEVPTSVYMNITYSTNFLMSETALVTDMHVRSKYSTKFSHNEFDFTEDANTTFYIYLYNFTTPYSFEMQFTDEYIPSSSLPAYIMYFMSAVFALILFFTGLLGLCTLLKLHIASQVTLKHHNDFLRIILEIVLIFVSSLILMLFMMTVGWRVRQFVYRYRLRQVTVYQFVHLNILEFFVAFISCFFLFLLIFVVTFKIKEKIDSIKQRRRRVVELRMMASRPVASINVELERNRPPDLLPSGKKSYPNVIAYEPCSEQKAAVASLFMQIPLPDNCEVPYGQTRLVLASALIQMKHKKIDTRDMGGARQRKQTHRVTVGEGSNCAQDVV